MINEEAVKRTFEGYTKNYDISDTKIGLKAAHTYRVAELSKRIALSNHMSPEDVLLSWLIGMLHDIARFEQCRIFDSFIDSKTLDHARFACHILFGDDIGESLHGKKEVDVSDYAYISIREFIGEDTYDELIHDAIYYHNVYRLPNDMCDRVKTFANILRDADKIDILKVNVETSLEEVYNVSTAQLKNDVITDKVLSELLQGRCINKEYKKTSVDNIAGHISLIFDLVYSESFKIVDEQGYLSKIMNYASDNPLTLSQFTIIRNYVNEFLHNAQK